MIRYSPESLPEIGWERVVACNVWQLPNPLEDFRCVKLHVRCGGQPLCVEQPNSIALVEEGLTNSRVSRTLILSNVLFGHFFCSTDPREAEWRRYQQECFGDQVQRFSRKVSLEWCFTRRVDVCLSRKLTPRVVSKYLAHLMIACMPLNRGRMWNLAHPIVFGFHPLFDVGSEGVQAGRRPLTSLTSLHLSTTWMGAFRCVGEGPGHG